jgi:hypothetical protein
MIYRQPPSEIRFVCLSCEALQPWPGTCPQCEVERLPVADPAVRLELAAARERRLQARAGREQRLLGAAAFLAASPLAWLAGWPIGVAAWFVVALAGTTLLWRVAARWRGSALHVFLRRRREA